MFEYDTYKTKDTPLAIKKVRELPNFIANSSDEVCNYMIKHYNLDEKTEEFLYAIYCKSSREVIGICEISRGAVNGSIISPAEIMKRALLLNAPIILLTHNHPRGRTKPSSDDIKVTKQTSQAANLLGLQLTDHIIVGGEDVFTSMLDEGLM